MNIILFAVCRSKPLFSNFTLANNLKNLLTGIRNPVSQFGPWGRPNGHRSFGLGVGLQQLSYLKINPAGCYVINLKPLPLSCSRANKLSCGKVFLNLSPLNVNTNVVKDVILFRYENSKFYTILNIFAVCQFLFWMYLSVFAYTSLKDTPVNRENEESLPWWRKINLGENKYRNGIAFVCFVIGYGVLASAWAFTLKSVRFLILRKGGQSLTFVTYGPFGKNRMLTAPLSAVSCEQARHAARVHLPIKVKGKYLFYVLDMRGEFTNPHLFDVTAGLKRT